MAGRGGRGNRARKLLRFGRYKPRGVEKGGDWGGEEMLGYVGAHMGTRDREGGRQTQE